MFQRILVANRGEIAVRVIRACRDMDIEPVAVYSTADESALHAQLAATAICIGGPRAGDSYLNMKNIITAAAATGCEAIHPGYGFLSENAEFAELTEQCGMRFIGPPAGVIRKMGNKAAARQLMIENGVPVVPGSDGAVDTAAQAREIAERIGYPVLIKAAAGGGGRGMRCAAKKEELDSAFETARAEAITCFGNGEMYVEKRIVDPKHVEVQILADSFGNIIHLGERDCSVQRRNQKLIEEAPCPVLSGSLRADMGNAAIKAARAAGYVNAGTVEFVLDSENHFYFIEMNTRIQVEHPVTEMVTGVDLVREQLRIAAGEPLSLTQEDVHFHGAAIECRINAEDPADHFRPSPGKIDFLHLPGGNGIRVDTMLYEGYATSPYYDSMAAKLIACGDTREEAICRMKRALEEMLIHGIPTNQGFEYLILHHPEFLSGRYDTGFLDRHLDELLAVAKDDPAGRF